MPSIHRVLDQHPIEALADYVAIGGGAGLDAARRLGGVGIAEEVTASGLRGRGGAGFPTGVKWETVAAEAASGPPPIVVVNGAEGEPGSFKDRTLLRRNPYRVLEGALIAATAIQARHVVVALKRTFQIERRRVAYAIAEMSDAGWLSDIDVRVSIGPSEYLFGEETALLEVVEGRQPFPRIAPPYRRGLTTDTDAPRSADPDGNDSPGVGLVLANNVETLANVPGIVSQGADWFRSLGTHDSPGTVVCTVSGDTRRAGVAEFPMGTPIAEIVDEIGGGALEQRRIVAAISGVANAILPVELFDTPACYDALRSVGSGLGAAGFIVFDDRADLIAVAEGVSRFLAVESCGQCEPCKRDGMVVAAGLDDLRRSESEGEVEVTMRDSLGTITDGARCYLATQHQVVATSILDRYPGVLAGHLDGSLSPADRVLIAPIVDIADGQVVLDPSQADKQPDWSYDDADSGRWPAASLGDTPVDVSPRRRPAAGTGAASSGAVASGGDDERVDGVDGVDLVDGADRPILIDVGDQLDLAHHELVAALLATAGGDVANRAAAVEAFADQLRRHVEVTTQILLPWVRRVGGDEGERVAERAEDIQSAAEDLVETLRRVSAESSTDGPHASSEVPLRDLADQLHRLILDEERRVLPLLERHLGESELDDIGRAMHEV
jgi:NADH:ubiquinone oxidoreductase subunit F (NADH-binding)